MAMNKKNNLSGRKIGSRNRIPKELKEMIRNALDKAGGEDYLVRQAKENPSAFMTLIGKIIPQEMKHAGEIAHTHTPLTSQELADRMDAIVRIRMKQLENEHGTE